MGFWLPWTLGLQSSRGNLDPGQSLGMDCLGYKSIIKTAGKQAVKATIEASMGLLWPWVTDQGRAFMHQSL